MKTITRAGLVTGLVCVASVASAQIYRCPDASGRTVVQQVPCMGGEVMDVRPASGRGPRPSSSARAAPGEPAADGEIRAAPQTEAQRLNANTEASMRERRRRELQDVKVPDARADVYEHRDRCELTQERLRARQYEYRQNLYGKAHAAQIASEIAAVAAQCDTRDRELETHFRRLLAECAELGGCAKIRP